MGKVGYILRMLKGSSFQKLNGVVSRVRERTGKSKLAILLDIIDCAVRYGAGYHDYIIFGFYDMTPAQRKTYVTRVINKKLISMLNDDRYADVFNEKNKFHARFTKYLGRGYLDLALNGKEDFLKFMEGKETIFAKPNIGESGKGIEKLETKEFPSLDAMYDYIRDPKKNFGVIEELIVQHEALSALYPLSINALRIVTLVSSDGRPHCIYVVSKMGNGGKYVDNLDNGGVCCPVDVESGCISGIGHTAALVPCEKHPYTGIYFLGYQLPYVKEAVTLCLQAALEIKEVRYVGWDVCITPTGPILIEGNNYPGYDFWQLPEHTPDKIGLLPTYRKLVPQL